MKKNVSISYLILLFVFATCSCNNNASQNSNINFYPVPLEKDIGFDYNEIGVVKDGVIKFYPMTNGNEKETVNMRFVLPPNCKDVIGNGHGGLFIITNNQLKYYKYERYDNIWEERDMEFILPENYQGVVYNGFIGIIVENILKFYKYDENDTKNWVEIIGEGFTPQFILPENCTGIFGYNVVPELALIVDNAVKFYGYYSGNWEEGLIPQFILPADCTSVFAYNYDWLCVSNAERIVFYYHFWKETEGGEVERGEWEEMGEFIK